MRILLAVLLGLFTLVATSCSAKTTLKVDVHPDGAGQIEVKMLLDEEAARMAPNLDEQFRDSDLVEAGWRLAKPHERDAGAVEYSIARSFSSPAEANQYLEQLTGKDGAFRDFRIEQSRSLLSVESKFNGTVDLSEGLDSFGNDSLVASTGSRLGFNAEGLLAKHGGDPNRVFPVEVVVNLPGDPVQVAPPTQSNTWQIPYGSQLDLVQSSRGIDFAAPALIVMGLVALVGAGLLAARWRNDFQGGRHFKKSAASK